MYTVDCFIAIKSGDSGKRHKKIGKKLLLHDTKNLDKIKFFWV